MKKTARLFLMVGIQWLLMLPSGQAQGLSSQEELGKVFVQSLQKKQFKLLTPLLASPSMYALISPSEVANKNEAALSKMKKVVEGRLKSKWSILLEEAKFYKIKTSQMTFTSVQQKEIDFENEYLHGLEVLASYSATQFSFLLIVVELEGTWYLLDIAQQSNVFSQ